MAICAASTFTDFLSDCADVVCADHFLVRHFLSTIAPGGGKAGKPRPLFSHVFAGGDTASPLTCGAVNLTPWVFSASTLASETVLIADGFRLHESAPRAPASNSSTPTSRMAPKYQWRLTTLIALVAAIFVALCIDAALLCRALPKWRHLRQQARETACREQPHAPDPATVKGVRVERRLERLLPPPAQGSIRTAAGCRKCEHGAQAPWGTAGTVYHTQAQHPAHAAQPVCIPTGRADEAQTPGAWREHRRALQTPTRRVAAPDHGIARLAAALGAGARHAGRASEGPNPEAGPPPPRARAACTVAAPCYAGDRDAVAAALERRTLQATLLGSRHAPQRRPVWRPRRAARFRGRGRCALDDQSVAGSGDSHDHVEDTPLPWGQLFILCVVLLTESVCWNVLIPFVPSFIAYIKGWDIDSSGYASGFPVSLFMLGQVLSGKIWGAFSNKVGPKTMISELTDTTNRAKGLALVSLTWGVGTLFGPAIGGFLYNPASSPKLAFLHVSPTSFMGRHPAFLPGAVVATYNLFAVVISVVFLRESNKSARPLREVLPRSVVKILGPVLRLVQPRLPCDKATEVTVIYADDHTEPNGAGPEKSPSAAARPVGTCVPEPHTHFGFKEAFLNPLLRRVCFISMLICTSDMMFTEIFPLWMAAESRNGGLQLSPYQMAILLLVNGAPTVLANIVFASVIKYSGGQFGSGLPVVPTATAFGTTSRFWFTMAMGMLRKVVESWNFALIMLFVSLTAPQGKVAIMFGIQQSTGCVVRCAVPFIFAPLFAWSISAPRPFPFNHYLVFLLSVIPLAIGAYLAAFVYIPSDDGGDGVDVEEHGSSSDMEGDSGGERRSGADSGRGSVRSRYSFFGSVTGDVQERESLLYSSFATAAIATAINPISGVVQNTIFTLSEGSPLQRPGEHGAGTAGRSLHESEDSRENSSQEGDEVDDNAEYATLVDEMEVMQPLISDGMLEHEDVRVVQVNELLEDEELPPSVSPSA
ncbi:putative integral membrane protein [Leishmania donovani]|uniref:Putative integral membrane protein n=1 Tax=Leishmania donovani TaxID=5661 RepID=A0A504XGT1_LEIDO|nr:putative integral membrane protein [Leishmania donovani]